MNGEDERVIAVQHMQDYIHSHVTEPITLADLAAVAHYSPWHSYRLFCEYTTMSVACYIRRLRLAQSAESLLRSNSNIADIAFAHGFASVDGYIRAFSREFGMTPGAWAHHPTPITLFHPYGVRYRTPTIRKRNYLMQETEFIYVAPLHKPCRKAIIKRAQEADNYWDYCRQVGCDVWGLLLSMDSLIGEPIGMWLPPQYRAPGTSEYVQGIEVGSWYEGPIPEGFDVIELPAADYLMIQGQPFEEKDYGQAIQTVEAAATAYCPEVLGYTWDTSNPRIQLEPKGERGYIEFRPVQPSK